MDRREFLKLFGGGAAVAGLGLLAGMLGCGKKQKDEGPGLNAPPGPPPGPEPGGPPPAPTNQPPQGG